MILFLLTVSGHPSMLSFNQRKFCFAVASLLPPAEAKFLLLVLPWCSPNECYGENTSSRSAASTQQNPQELLHYRISFRHSQLGPPHKRELANLSSNPTRKLFLSVSATITKTSSKFVLPYHQLSSWQGITVSCIQSSSAVGRIHCLIPQNALKLHKGLDLKRKKIKIPHLQKEHQLLKKKPNKPRKLHHSFRKLVTRNQTHAVKAPYPPVLEDNNSF